MTEWIKCSDRMPEYNVDVLICHTFKHWHTVCSAILNKCHHGDYWGPSSLVDGYDAGLDISDEKYVTHWMPLPSPPEVE